MDHRRHVELDHLLVQRIPPPVGERRVLPVAARRIGVQVAADEAELLHAALELRDAVRGRDAGRLRQLAHADEILRVERHAAVDQVVAELRPRAARRGVADVVRHPRRPRREDREIGAALALQLELRALEARAHLVVADLERALRRRRAAALERRDLRLAPGLELARRGGVVAVAVDDHVRLASPVFGPAPFYSGRTPAGVPPEPSGRARRRPASAHSMLGARSARGRSPVLAQRRACRRMCTDAVARRRTGARTHFGKNLQLDAARS